MLLLFEAAPEKQHNPTVLNKWKYGDDNSTLCGVEATRQEQVKHEILTLPQSTNKTWWQKKNVYAATTLSLPYLFSVPCVWPMFISYSQDIFPHVE